jgi:hypothetical protein
MKLTGMVLILSLSNLPPIHSLVKPTMFNSAATSRSESNPQLAIVLAERNYIIDQNNFVELSFSPLDLWIGLGL